MRWGTAVVAAVALVLALPVTAGAATRYVANGGLDSTACTDPGAACATVQHATEVAANADTVQIAAGVYNESVSTEKVLTFIGAGAGTLDGIPFATLIRGPSASGAAGSPALVLPNGGEVRSLRAEGGKGADEALTTGEPGGEGIVYDSKAPGQSALRLDHVVAIGGNGGAGKTPEFFEFGAGGRGIEANGGPGVVVLSVVDCEFAGGTGLGHGDGVSVDGPDASADLLRSKLESPGTGAGIVGFSGARLSLDSVEIDGNDYGATIYEGSMTIRRSRVLGEYAVEAVASGGTTSTAEVTDSLVISTGGTAAESYSYDEGSISSLNIVGSTIVGLGSVAAVRTTHEEESGAATVTLRNSIARHLPPPKLPPADLLANGGTINADFSSFTTRLEENGGTATAPGSAGNLVGDPLFVDPNKGDFALQGSSALIDRGNTALVGAGELDLAGSPRSLDGNRDCAPAPDIGAYEVTGQGVACDPAPTISKFGITNKVFAPKGGKGKKKGHASKAVKRGTKFTYTLSEPAKVKIKIERKKKNKKNKKTSFTKVTTLSAQEKSGKQSTPFSGRVKGKPLKPGKYRATITATDSAGQTSAPLRLSFKIVSG